MKIKVSTNALEVSGFMRDLFQDQLPFATQQAVRASMLDIQVGQRLHQRSVFTARRKTFLDRAVKIRDWPTKQDPSGIVRIEPSGGPSRVSILADHEAGGTRPPAPGHRARSVERDVRPSPERIAPKRLRPKELGFKQMSEGTERSFVRVFRGDHRTFMIRYRDGSGFIFQRTGPGSSGTLEGTKLLWVLSPGGVELQPTLKFYDNAERILAEMWPRHMAAAWERALRTAR